MAYFLGHPVYPSAQHNGFLSHGSWVRFCPRSKVWLTAGKRQVFLFNAIFIELLMNDTTKVRKLHKPMQPCLDVTAGQLKLSNSHVDNHWCRLLQTEPLYRAVYVVFSCFKHKRLLLRFLHIQCCQMATDYTEFCHQYYYAAHARPFQQSIFANISFCV